MFSDFQTDETNRKTKVMLLYDPGAEAGNPILNGRRRVADALVQRNLAAAGYPIHEGPEAQQRKEIGLALARIKDRSQTAAPPVQVAFNETPIGSGVTPRALDFGLGRATAMPLHGPGGSIREGVPGRLGDLPTHSISHVSRPMGQLFGAGEAADPVQRYGQNSYGGTQAATSTGSRHESRTGNIPPSQREAEARASSGAVPQLVRAMRDGAVSTTTLRSDTQSGEYHLPSTSKPVISEDDAYNVYRDGHLFGTDSNVDRLRDYVNKLPKMRSYTPSPSENRSYWLRQNLGQYVGRRVNETVDVLDPITPVRDFVHRRKQGYPLGAEDAELALDAAATVAAPFAGKMLVRGLRSVPKFYRGADGNVDLGHINKQIEEVTDGRQPEGQIHMEWGENRPGGFGALHITEDKHKRARRIGYRDAHHLIEDVSSGFTEVVEQANGKLMLVKRGEDGANRYVITKFQRGSWLDSLLNREPYHGVTTGYPEGRKNVGKRSEILKRSLEKPENKLLWKKEP